MVSGRPTRHSSSLHSKSGGSAIQQIAPMSPVADQTESCGERATQAVRARPRRDPADRPRSTPGRPSSHRSPPVRRRSPRRQVLLDRRTHACLLDHHPDQALPLRAPSSRSTRSSSSLRDSSAPPGAAIAWIRPPDVHHRCERVEPGPREHAVQIGELHPVAEVRLVRPVAVASLSCVRHDAGTACGRRPP